MTLIRRNSSASNGHDVETSLPDDLPKLGQWYWVIREDASWDEEEEDDIAEDHEWLGCVIHVGSNFIKIKGPPDKYGYECERIHFDNIPDRLRFEPHPEGVIRQHIHDNQEKIKQYLAQVNAITARLGVNPQPAISYQEQTGDKALAVLSGKVDISRYEKDLIHAKEKDLPALFEKIKDANSELSKWMCAETLPYEAMSSDLSSSLDAVNDRIFNVSLYAGLTETIVQCAEGDPAAYNEKLHLMQRRTYMDEETLLSYTKNGMEFKDIDKFDAWLCKPKNRDRILPFPRCMVSMRVRRYQKERDSKGSFLKLLVNIDLGRLDEMTFLYIRNGDQVYRLNCDLDFGEMLFPDKAMFDPSAQMMVKMYATRVDSMITVHDFEERVREQREYQTRFEHWAAAHPDNHEFDNPFRWKAFDFDPDDWAPFDQSNVYYDDCLNEVTERMNKYNRVALIIQGLFDRSEVLHPHPVVRTWDPVSFNTAVKLIYDASNVLHYQEAPDFEAYRDKCNASLKAGSVTVGQEDAWQRREAEKECRRRDRDWRDHSEYRPNKFEPYGDPGPGYVAKIARWMPRARKAVFTWYRDSRVDIQYAPIRTTITVPEKDLFNVSAYTPGDYLQFFYDPRTRAKYLQWAPLLLAAEEYHAGLREVQTPVD